MFAFLLLTATQAAPAPLPKVESLSMMPGSISLGSSLSVWASPGLENEVVALRRALPVEIARRRSSAEVVLLHTAKEGEGYSLLISKKGVVLSGSSAGVFYGIQTLKQLLSEPPLDEGGGGGVGGAANPSQGEVPLPGFAALPPTGEDLQRRSQEDSPPWGEISPSDRGGSSRFKNIGVTPSSPAPSPSKKEKGISLPCLKIQDSPRFPWRGFMLDDSRHFFPKQAIFRLLDEMAAQKLNKFHWHLNDDGGWRLEIKKYPKLTQIGAWRLPTNGEYEDNASLSFPGPGTGQKLYGGFHTRAEVKEIIAYAAKRHIEVIPEIEMPGHNLAATMSYPDLICRNADVAGYANLEGWQLPNMFCPSRESTYRMMEGILDEVLQLFPSKVIHLGGDEVEEFTWRSCPDCQGLMRERGLTRPTQLMNVFMRRMEAYLASKGRRLMGWDDIMDGGVPERAMVMSWRGTEGGIEASQAGHQVVMAPHQFYYLAVEEDRRPLDQVYSFDPVPAELPESAKRLILGGQACLWTERITDWTSAEKRLFPRWLAVSEKLWAKRPDSFEAFQNRLATHYGRLAAEKVPFTLQAPVTQWEVVSVGSKPIQFLGPEVQGANLRFTEDGSDPTADSPVSKGTIPADRAKVIRARIQMPDGELGPIAQVVVGRIEPVTRESPQSGLHWIRSVGNFQSLSDAKNRKPIAQGVTTAIEALKGSEEDYALWFTGFVKIEKAGAYTLFTSSDDGSGVWMGGCQLVNNDGLHGFVERSGRIELNPGFYPLEIGFFQAKEGQRLEVGIQGPGLPKQVIPASMLWH